MFIKSFHRQVQGSYDQQVQAEEKEKFQIIRKEQEGIECSNLEIFHKVERNKKGRNTDKKLQHFREMQRISQA